MEGLTEVVEAFGGWADAGGLVFGGICFIMVITGQLMPARTFKTVEKDRDVYKQASETKDKTIAKQAEIIEYLSKEVGSTVVQTMEGLPKTEQEETLGQAENAKTNRKQLLDTLMQWRQ